MVRWCTLTDLFSVGWRRLLRVRGGQKKCRVPSSTFRKMKKATAEDRAVVVRPSIRAIQRGRPGEGTEQCYRAHLHFVHFSPSYLSIYALRCTLFLSFFLSPTSNVVDSDVDYNGTGSTLNQPIYITPLMGMLSTRNRKLATYSVMYVCSTRLCLLRE